MGAVTLVGFAGSLRAESYNRLVLERLVTLCPDDVTLDVIDLAEVPFYERELDREGGTDATRALQDRVRAADGLVIVTPEYNFSMPAVTKNAVDWLSRPVGEGALNSTPVGLVAVTPGRSGGAGVLNHLGDVVSIISPHPYDLRLGIGSIRHRRGEDGGPDTELLDELRTWVRGFVDFVGSVGSKADREETTN